MATASTGLTYGGIHSHQPGMSHVAPAHEHTCQSTAAALSLSPTHTTQKQGCASNTRIYTHIASYAGLQKRTTTADCKHALDLYLSISPTHTYADAAHTLYTHMPPEQGQHQLQAYSLHLYLSAIACTAVQRRQGEEHTRPKRRQEVKNSIPASVKPHMSAVCTVLCYLQILADTLDPKYDTTCKAKL